MLHASRGSECGRHGPLVLGVLWTEASVATILIALRIYAACLLVKRLHWDLVWAVVAWSIACAAQGALTYAVLIGANRHGDQFTARDDFEFRRWTIVQACVSTMSVAFGRIAVISSLLHLQERVTIKARCFLHVIWIVNIGLAILEIAFVSTNFSPLSQLWTQNTATNTASLSTDSTGYEYLKPEIAALVNGIFGALSDVLLATYAVLLFWSWKLSIQRKIGLSTLMGGGVCCTAAGFLKVYYLTLVRNDDVFIAPLNVWTDTEMWFIIIFGSIPCLRVIAKHIHRQCSKEKIERRRHSVSPSTEPLHCLHAHTRRNLSRLSLTRRVEAAFGSILEWSDYEEEQMQPIEKQVISTTHEIQTPEDVHLASVRGSVRSFSFICQWPDDSSQVIPYPPRTLHEVEESSIVQKELEDV